MKKNLVKAFAAAFAAVGLGLSAAAGVSGGDIYSVDLVARDGSLIPTKESPLTIGETVTVRLRLVNRGYDDVSTAKEWRFVPTTGGSVDPTKDVFAPQLGLMLGGQQVYADFAGQEQVEVGSPKVKKFTDLFFRYRVKSGDLALPARFMAVGGKAIVDDDDATDYAIHFCNYLGNYWKLSNDDNDLAIFHFCAEDVQPDPSWSAGEPQRYVTGSELGIFVETVDFDKNYSEDPDVTKGTEGIWRKLYVGLTDSQPSAPTVKVEGQSETPATMYVWVEDPTIANVVAADKPELIDGRQVIKVPIAKGQMTQTFRLQGVSKGTTHVRMSSSRNLTYYRSGDLVEDWVERPVFVDDPPDPYVRVETLNPAGEAQTEFAASSDYENFVGMFRITLTQAPTAPVTVKLSPSDTSVIPAELENRLMGLSFSNDATTMPWEDRELSVDFDAGEQTKTLYIYALDEFDQKGGKVTFAPSVEGPGAGLYAKGKHVASAVFLGKMAPEVLIPAEGETVDSATLREDYTMFLTVASTYRSLRRAGWKVQYTSDAAGDSKMHDATSVEVLDEEAGELSADMRFSKAGASQKLQFRVTDPNGNKSPWRAVYFDVNEGKGIFATHDKEQYAESETAQARISFALSQTAGDDLYLFLEPLNDAAQPEQKRVSTPQLAKDGNTGIKISAGNLTPDGGAVAMVSLLDGGYGANYYPEFKVVACTKRGYDSRYVLPDWEGGVTLAITNVEPKVVEAVVNGTPVKDGGALGEAIVMGITKKFSVKATEPGRTDKTAEGLDAFRTQWKFGTDDWLDMDGNPGTAVLEHAFYAPGNYEVQVRCQDKDMRELDLWSDTLTFTLRVLETPAIVISPVQDTKQYYEDQTGIDTAFQVMLTAAPKFSDTTKRLKVTLTKELLGDPSQYSLDDLVLSKDSVEFVSGKADGQSFYLKQLDGTVESGAAGFRIIASVEGDVVDDDGKKWEPGETEFYILNRDPKIVLPNEQLRDKDDNPVPTPTTVGGDNTLNWSLSDVAFDKQGMTVTFNTSEGAEWTYTQGTPGWDDVMKGTHKWAFTSSGDKSITMTATDKDGGSASRTWYYTIEASKTLTAIPHGPATGFGTKNSSRYQSALGLGAGRVWAKNSTAVEGHRALFNCGVSANWALYAYGYKVDDIDDGVNLHRVDGTLGYYLDRDLPINTSGNDLKAGGTAYRYQALTDQNGQKVDSFLYAWLQIATGKDGGTSLNDTLYGNAPHPEYSETADTGITVLLPSQSDQGSKSYDETLMEAVFSREWLATDNMGDINQDGVPDIYVSLYDLLGSGSSSSTAGSSVDDLKPITNTNKGNDDADYLPLTGNSSKMVPGLPGSWADGTPFAAKTEIRGYGNALNDAPLLIGLTGVKPERRYTDPRVDKRSTLDGLDPNGSNEPVEYYAWRTFAAAHGLNPDDEKNWELWSPECPSNPTLADTDDDGFADGYEYFIWYRAHVGYMDRQPDGTLVHKHLTGRKYDPRNPGAGKLITHEEIEQVMNPRMPFGDSDAAKLRDTDNDGLPDLLEFEIGTNPFDFDTDGDGLPDGFELMMGGTDPLLAFTAPNISDAMRNFDGDAMAYSAPWVEKSGLVIPPLFDPPTLYSFAVIDPNGDSDGVQWYVTREEATCTVDDEPAGGRVLQVSDEEKYYTTATGPLTAAVGEDVLLAVDLPRDRTWVVADVTNLTNSVSCLIPVAENDPTALVRLAPAHLGAGLRLQQEPAEVDGATVHVCVMRLESVPKETYSAWIYGNSDVSRVTTGDDLANKGEFGFLSIGRRKFAPHGAVLTAPIAQDDRAAFLHYLVYQEFGFDPRTAWNATTPVGVRWGSTADTVLPGTETSADAPELLLNNYNANAGISTRTREYTLYDEFLLFSFFLNTGVLDPVDYTPRQDWPWDKIWSKFTTNGQGPHEPFWDETNEHFKGRTAPSGVDGFDVTNGADTDMDGVPDGWELYIMSGPKPEGDYGFRFVAPYNQHPYSDLGPFVNKAGTVSATDNEAFGLDADGLTELEEYAGTDSCKYYAEPWMGNEYPFSSTIALPESMVGWVNKFMPTDPWNADTDGDGLDDKSEMGAFKYGTAYDDGTGKCFAGGGLNPLSMDTDMDGLPDPWEAQFAGMLVYAGEDAEYQEGPNGERGNPKQGLCDGMDGTVWDACNSPRILTSPSSNSVEELVVSLDGVKQIVDRDYDHDGLENWQEYMTGAMRCWRYDDPVTRWDGIPFDYYFNVFGGWNPDYEALAVLAGVDELTEDDLLYYTLFDMSSPIYNPHLLTDMSPCMQYFTRVKNGWDLSYSDEGTYYMLMKLNGVEYADLWGYVGAKFSHYVCTSPLKADTDQDGMDDFYELFHGLNPLLGAAGVTTHTGHPCDIVYDAWYDAKSDTSACGSAVDNVWRKSSAPYDFELYPWLAGLVDADPDGDDIRNQDEAIMPLVAPSVTWYHTDPTPLWMTDSTYEWSIVRQFYRMPTTGIILPLPGESIVHNNETFSLHDCDGFGYIMGSPVIFPFSPDQWEVADGSHMNWMYSFEENEGYDTDHDFGSDYEELQGKYRAKTDPQDADSPRRRQAMYFAGPSNPSALQSMPFSPEVYPRAAKGWPDDMSLLQYTVACWVRPETLADATLIERGVYTGPSHSQDEQYLRCNFRLAIKDGRWYTMFDPNGTLSAVQVEVLGSRPVKAGEWAYVAATYDANKLTLYVNGEIDGYTPSSLKPTYGSSAVVIYPGNYYVVATNGVVQSSIVDASEGNPNTYWFDREYAMHAFLIGASFKNDVDLGGPENAQLNVVNGRGWSRYKDFFTGYVDEVRVWDGAVDADTIAENYRTRKRFTREDALENRSAFYKQWVSGRRRYAKNGNGDDLEVIPELRFHWAFDSLPAAENPESVIAAPHGFLDGPKAPWSSPAGYVVSWWDKIVNGTWQEPGYGSVYAGECNWVPWIPNTVTHLPRFDGSTLDSQYWSENFCGINSGIFRFARTAEPVSRWSPITYNEAKTPAWFKTTARRFWQMNVTGTNVTSTLPAQFAFTSRHLNLLGDDLLPLGGAFVKYVDRMWDDQGASTTWEQTGVDRDFDGLPDWWQEYADQNYRDGLDPHGEPVGWDSLVSYEIGGEQLLIPAYEAYQRDLAKGVYVDEGGIVHPTAAERAVSDKTAYEQTAKTDKLIPDWWKAMKKIDNEPPFDDTDRDGLNNYVEYVASELLPFRLRLDPQNPMSRAGELDYFRKPYDGASELYIGEMLTDHDQMEDHWERSLGNSAIANAAVWDALKDADEDGWTNFAENRYNGYAMSTLAQLVSHAVGNGEVLDAPIPTVRMKVRYGGSHLSAGSSNAAPQLVVRSFTRDSDTGAYSHRPDAQWTVRLGQSASGSVYLGGWENRVVRGTMAPGNVDIGSIDLEFAQVPQSDLYSWTDENGLHVSMPYAEFKAALEKNPGIIQNIQNFEWLHLASPFNEYTSADKAVTVTRDDLLQTGYIAVYGERVGTIDLTTGDFEFDLAAMNTLSLNYTFGANGVSSAWGYKEAIFRLSYKAMVPSMQLKACDISLAKPDTGFVRSGLNAFEAFYDLDGDGNFTPGEPFGVITDVDVGWSGRNVEIELTDMSAVMPRVDLWTDQSDRQDRVGTATFTDGSNRFMTATAPAPKSRVRVVRYKVDGLPVYKIGVNAGVVLDRVFESDEKTYLQEGEFLSNGSFDIDWNDLYRDVTSWTGALRGGCDVTNVTYLVVFNWDASEYASDTDTNTVVKALSTLVTRRFETDRSIPTACSASEVCYLAQPTFSWKIENEDMWASWFGTTYTAFKIRVKDTDGNLVYDSGIRRLPAKDTTGVYSWTAPIYAGSVVPSTGRMFANKELYTWEVAVYNAKFSTDDLLAVRNNRLVTGNAFSTPETFRMNVTTADASSERLAVRVCYAGPAKNLLDKIRVQAFKSPDFTGDPAAETTLRYLAEGDTLSPAGTDANVEVFGLPAGSYFVRAYIDTNGNGVHDDWESWGYLSERDRASKPGIFNPVSAATASDPSLTGVRKLYIEDCDTDGDWFPDVWEAERNGNVFDRTKIHPVSGDAELLGVNPQLKSILNLSDFPVLETLCSKSGLALLSGVEPTKVRVIENSDGTLGILVENKVETVKVTSMDFDADGNVEIKVAAATAPIGLDADMLKLFNAKLATQKTVTCTVYRRASLAAKDPWTKAGTQVITIGSDEPATVTVSGGKAGQGFYKVEIED